MSSLLFPTLPGLTFDVVRTPVWHTERQQALSGKRSTLAYMQYPLIHFELTFSVLRDDVAVSEIKQVVGLFNALQAGYDNFLFTDPDFNTVSIMQYGTTDGTTLVFPLTAQYGAGGYGYSELIQNVVTGTLSLAINRYGSLIEYPLPASRTQFCLQSSTYTNASWSKTNCSAVIDGALVAPDGSVPFALVDTTTANVQHFMSQGFPTATAAGVYTFSIFVWNGAAEASFIVLQLGDITTGNLCEAVFNTQTGAVSNVGSTGVWTGVVFEVSAVNSQWNRFSIAVTYAGGTGGIGVFLTMEQVAGVATYAGTIGAGMVALWGAQFENAVSFPPSGGAFPTMYIPTTTATVTQQDIVGIDTTFQIFINANNFGSIHGIKLLWSGSFYYRCAFDEDKLDLVKFMNKWWTIKKLPFTSEKL